MELADLKAKILELLREDVEFRYAVAGMLGLDEILRRFEKHDKRFEEILAEIRALREDQHRLWENQNKLWEEVKNLREGQNKLWENVNKLWEEVRALREGQDKLWENVNRLWEEVRSLRLGQEDMRRDLRDVKRTVERLALSLEDEARDVIAHRLKRELGVEVELERAFADGLEINVYGATEDLCIVGEVAVRLGPGLVEELLEKVEALRRRRPDLLRKKVLKVIYASVAIPQALQLAQENNVWVLKWDRDLTPMKIEEVQVS